MIGVQSTEGAAKRFEEAEAASAAVNGRAREAMWEREKYAHAIQERVAPRCYEACAHLHEGVPGGVTRGVFS